MATRETITKGQTGTLEVLEALFFSEILRNVCGFEDIVNCIVLRSDIKVGFKLSK